MNPAAAFAALGLAIGAAPAEVRAAANAHARVLHPDVPGTGDAGEFEAMRQAYSVALNYAIEEPCLGCGGLGKALASTKTTWRSLYIQCPACAGSGRRHN